jgi:formylglycine-generating enzyme
MRAAVIIVLACASLAVGNVLNMPPGLTSLEMVTVGNPGNAGELSGPSAGGRGFDGICGSVDYAYKMGKFEVTAGQYCEFLNAVAKTDTYGLYSPYMNTMYFFYGCNIVREQSNGRYSYSVAPDGANRPVNLVSWGDAARFCNWLTNGQPTGDQDLTTTEDGSYYLNGATDPEAMLAVVRKPDAHYVIPTENEWYKAAYYDPEKPGGAGYWDYATRSDMDPGNLLSATGTTNANYWNGDSGAIGAPYYRTEMGAFADSPSAYGTFDQSGNVWELNETLIGSSPGLRGGAENTVVTFLRSSSRWSVGGVYGQDQELGCIGFRIAEVPEPATLLLLVLGSLAVIRRWR